MDIVAAIDQAVGCHTCGGSLESSVSDLFCSEYCQAAWHARGSVGTGWLSMHRNAENYPLSHFRWSPEVWSYLQEGEGQ